MNPFLNTATTLVLKAGKIIAQAVERLDEVKVSIKSKNNFVTTVDLAVEEEIIYGLKKAYPDHAILAEETGSQGSEQSDYQWIIDPLDGTTNFIHGYPHFCIAIALKHKNRIEQAVIYDPIRDEMYSASYGGGAHKNNRRIRISKENQLANTIVGTVLPASQIHLREPFFDSAKLIMSHCRTIRIAGSAALDLAYVGAGQLDGFWSMGLKPWDIAAASLIIKEAGGIVIDFQGGEDYLTSGNVIAANPKLIKQLVENLKSLIVALK
ncbi:MAG: inositol monophosphatase [Gammaproteobacteria bacterium RIFCSPHIGHO2_12_FULL_35_23]|nr:MAG: inositol monophosphatase [Gammaproteobacteria bacterium RIFCSPHIGHO2_12_FULL_35_23]